MKILITLLKPLSFVPALLMMYIIFSFSAQTGESSGNLSYQISYDIVEIKSDILSENKSSDQLAYEQMVSLLCEKSGPYDRVFSAGNRDFFSTVCIWCKRNLADDPGRNRMCGIRRTGRISSVFCGQQNSGGKGCGDRQHRRIYRYFAGTGILLVRTE